MEATWWTKPEHLDKAQKEILSLDKDDDHIVCGPPGSGKTNLLLLRAAYLFRANRRNFKIITYGRILREFLATGTAHYPFSPDRISTFSSWVGSLARDAGTPIVYGKDEDANRINRVKMLEKIANKSDFRLYDCLLVDECQDYSPEELSLICKLATTTFFAGDDRQEIYGKRGGLDYIIEKIESVYKLTAHYRNGHAIYRVADSIYNESGSATGLEANSQYDEALFPSTVSVNGPLSVQQQVDLAADEISNQLIAYASGYIGILCPRKVDVDTVEKLLGTSTIADQVHTERFSSGYSPLPQDKRVLLMTMHGAKGLEFRAAHLLCTDQIRRFGDQKARLAYTVVTRAKTYLGLYYESAMPGFLDKAATCGSTEVVSDPELKDLFV